MFLHHVLQATNNDPKEFKTHTHYPPLESAVTQHYIEVMPHNVKGHRSATSD